MLNILKNNKSLSHISIFTLILCVFISKQITQAATINAQNSQIEVGFSPEGSAEKLIIQLINSAQSSINLAGYSFTSAPIVRALIQAKKRGVDVSLILDEKANLQNNAAKYALKLISNAGIKLRTINIYQIHHDKYIISDQKNIETGSYNYTKSAAKYNSENVIVIKDNAELAKQYMQHWQSRWNDGVDFIYNN